MTIRADEARPRGMAGFDVCDRGPDACRRALSRQPDPAARLTADRLNADSFFIF
jgi:hypothetical protein